MALITYPSSSGDVSINNISDAFEFYFSHPAEQQQFLAFMSKQFGSGWVENFQRRLPYEQAIYQAQYGDGSWNEVYRQSANTGVEISPELEKYMDNAIAQENTQSARDFETQMRDTQYLSAGQQAQQLGLSPSVVSVGSASSNPVAAADVSHSSTSSLRQQRQINDYNQKMGIAKSLIGMAGSMASSGIYGHAIGAARHAASQLSAATAHSALKVLKKSSHPQALINKLAADGNNYMFDKLGLG